MFNKAAKVRSNLNLHTDILCLPIFAVVNAVSRICINLLGCNKSAEII